MRTVVRYVSNFATRLGLVMALALAVACEKHSPAKHGSPKPLRGVVLIVIEPLRADHVSSYGHDRPTTPHIDGLASQGVRFEQAVTCAPWSLPSVASLLAGEYPGKVDTQQRRLMSDDSKLQRSIVDLLRNAEVQTAAFTEGKLISKQYGLERGFAVFEQHDADDSAEATVARTFGAAEQWLETQRRNTQRFFVLIHTAHPQLPYTDRTFVNDMDAGRIGPAVTADTRAALRMGELTLTDEETDYLRAMYDGDIHTVDQHVGRLVEHLKALGIDNETAIIVTGSHGEELHDHYPAYTGDHGHSLHDEMLHVPLILVDPTAHYELSTVPAQVRLIDVMPTVAAMLRVAVDRPIDGANLVPMMQGQEKIDRPALAAYTLIGPPRIALRHQGYKIIATVGPDAGYPSPMTPAPPARAMYDLKADPDESINIADMNRTFAEQLHREMLERYNTLNDPTHSAAGQANEPTADPGT